VRIARISVSTEFLQRANRMAIEAQSGRVQVRLTESFRKIHDGVLSMRHTRAFFGALSRQVISLLIGLKFYGVGGLMAASTADSEEDSTDGTSRFIKTFRPMGASFGTSLAGSFHVLQELHELSSDSLGPKAVVRMSFFPATPKHLLPEGSFLWEIEPSGSENSLWREFINTEETRVKHLPNLRVPRKWLFQFGHNRLMGGAAQRIAEVLNRDSNTEVAFAQYAETARYNFWPNTRT